MAPQNSSAETEAETCCLPQALDPHSVFLKYKETRKLAGAIYSMSNEHPCKDFYAATCSDPQNKSVLPMLDTGLNKNTYDQQEKVLREILSEWGKLPPETRPDKQDYLTTRYYEKNDFDTKIDRWDEILINVKAEARRMFDARDLDEESARHVERIIDMIKIDRSYKRYPGTIFESTAYVDIGTILVGGNLLNTMTSEDAIYFILAHEMAHTLKRYGPEVHTSSYQCIEKKFGKMKVMGKKISTEEVWCDWFAHQLYIEFVYSRTKSPREQIKYMKNSLRFFCGYEGSNYGHPSGEFRAKFFSTHPQINDILCKEFTGENPAREYCP